MPVTGDLTIEALKPISAGKVLGGVFGVIGLIAGLAFFFGLPVPQIDVVLAIAGLGALSVAVYPVLFGIAGFGSGVVIAMIYNVVADLTGGLEIETDKD